MKLQNRNIYVLCSKQCEVIKRVTDLVFSLFLLFSSLPIFFILSLAVSLTSKGPVFYKQVRCTKNKRQFYMYKFRTMAIDAEKDTGPIWAKRNDGRMTPIGDFLRKTHLDEFPQLINVIKGDMSLVGPRPERPHFVNLFEKNIPNYKYRHLVKAGLTGWAQINGYCGNTSLYKRIQHDTFYVKNWSLWLDIKIIIRTLLNRKNIEDISTYKTLTPLQVSKIYFKELNILPQAIPIRNFAENL